MEKIFIIENLEHANKQKEENENHFEPHHC